jgi:DNA-binding SARP family transcriptional activator
LRSALARLERTCRTTPQASKLELSLADGVAVSIRHAQTLARRLLDPAVTPEQSDLTSAAIVALSRDLLPGWYDDWVLVEAEDWRQLRLHGLGGASGRLTAVGCWGQAADAASAAVRAEPLRESAHAALIQVHLAAGNQSEALREFTRYRAHVRRTTDVSQGFEQDSTVVEKEAVVAAVQAWLSEMLAGSRTGEDDSGSLSDT